ncbi:MAG: hypothetical protein V9E82_06185 [Candidatus Nanopelagicales bacterium]
MRVQVIFAGVLAGGLLAASPAQAAIGEPATDPTGAIFRFDEWTRGQVGFNQRYTGFPNYPYMTYAMAGVDVPAQTPPRARSSTFTSGQVCPGHSQRSTRPCRR